MKHDNDLALRKRAAQVIPGGMYGHLSVNPLPSNYPQFFERAEGCRLWDTDGNEYIDFMCAYGPMIAGYGNQRIRAAANQQWESIDAATGPSPVMIDLAERMVGQVTHADWAMFAKNGNDATTVCNMLARARSEKRKILVAGGAYHGWHPWANRVSRGTPVEEHVHHPTYVFNDVESVRTAAASTAGDLAGIVVSGFKHDMFVPQEMPTVEFARACREICDAEGAALILDDVRAGLRLSFDASWSAQVGVQPDLSAWGKALANGEPVAAILGNEAYHEAATKILATGSFWYQASSFAAALETLDVLQECDAPARMEALGQTFRDGLDEQARKHGYALLQTGPPQMPLVRFENDKRLERGLRFCNLALEYGVYLHPGHNMFLSVAHTEADIEQALAGTAKAFERLG